MAKIAFDVDDTLIIPAIATGYVGGYNSDTPNYTTIALYNTLKAQGNHMIVWSRQGKEYAQKWSYILGLDPHETRDKIKSDDVDIAFDDQDLDLAKVNVRVKRINNSISRK